MKTRGLKKTKLKSIVWSFICDSFEDSVKNPVRNSVYDYVPAWNRSVYDSIRSVVFNPVLKSTDNSVWNSIARNTFTKVRRSNENQKS
jgi:hypothetical protein